MYSLRGKLHWERKHRGLLPERRGLPLFDLLLCRQRRVMHQYRLLSERQQLRPPSLRGSVRTGGEYSASESPERR